MVALSIDITKMSKAQKALFSIITIVAIGAVVGCVVLANKLTTLQTAANASQTANAAEVQKTVDAVGKFIVLPENEVPTMATVSDPEKLKDQPFFKNSEVGDVVLIYPLARKAILWRPSSDKIIEVSAINIPSEGTPAQTSAPTPSPTSTKKI